MVFFTQIRSPTERRGLRKWQPKISMTSLCRILAIAAFAAVGWPSDAGAAYQIMGLIASAGAVPLTCSRGECSAEFSSFCLQPDRASPPRGAQYYAIGGAGITVIGTTVAGRTLTITRADDLRITAQRGHNAVRISISDATLSALGLKSIAIDVGEGVSLVPEPIVGDPNPQTEVDIALATGPLRVLGSRIVDRGGDTTMAARLTNDLINALPEGGRVGPDVRDGLWDAAARARLLPAVTPGARKLARGAYELCRAKSAGGSILTLRQCLGSRHDRFLGALNNAYWDMLKLGS